MSQRTKCLLTSALALCLALAATPGPTAAQAPEKTFNLSHTEIDTTRQQGAAEVAPHSEPQIVPGELEASLTLGYLNLNTTLLSHSQIIYKVTDERTYWGDVKLIGESAFNPILRLNYNLKPWFALEGRLNFSVSEYQATISNRYSRENAEGATPIPNPELGEFDAEHRSVLTYGVGISGLVYPFNIAGSRISRWQPYVTGNVDRIRFDLNSNYVDGASGEMVLGFGGGLRFVADEMVSIRLEATYQTTDLQLEPARNFEVLEEGTRPIPVYEYPEGWPQRVTSFASHKISGMAWSLGFVASF